MESFEHAYAERYFSSIRRLLKEADPNHLYLGCRFVRNMPPPRIAEVTDQPHVDMVDAIRQIAANTYRWHMESATGQAT